MASILFSKGSGVAALFVRVGQALAGHRCIYTHCGILTETGTVIHSHPRYGVVEQHMVQKDWDEVLYIPQIEIDYVALRQHLGEGYDFGEILLWPTGFDFKRRYYCSELVALAIGLVGDYSPGRLYHALRS